MTGWGFHGHNPDGPDLAGTVALMAHGHSPHGHRPHNHDPHSHEPSLPSLDDNSPADESEQSMMTTESWEMVGIFVVVIISGACIWFKVKEARGM